MGTPVKVTNNARKIRTRGKGTKVVQTEDQSPEWVINISNFLKNRPDGMAYDAERSRRTIYRVPSNMQKVYRNAYIPKILSVGPFHYGHQRLQVMEEHKTRFLLRLLGSREDCLEELVGAMRLLEHKTRERYSEAFSEINSDDFVQMMVLDGCFVVELLRLHYKFNNGENIDDPIFTKRWMLGTLQGDLLMLENQLPFFVLEELFRLTSLAEEPSLIVLTPIFFEPLSPSGCDRPNNLNPGEPHDHLLAVFRSTFISYVKEKMPASSFSEQHKETRTNTTITPPGQKKRLILCVKELEETGVTLTKMGHRDLLDIQFNGGVLEIPPLFIGDNNVSLFLNFVAYEQCDKDVDFFFTHYTMFFDSLINSREDVELLHKNGIINHFLGSNKDVADLVNKLSREIVYDLDECYLSNEMKRINDHCEAYNAYYASKWHVWWANFIHDYFSSPWTFISLLAAIVLLILTVLQTLYTVLPYYRQV